MPPYFIPALWNSFSVPPINLINIGPLALWGVEPNYPSFPPAYQDHCPVFNLLAFRAWTERDFRTVNFTYQSQIPLLNIQSLHFPLLVYLEPLPMSTSYVLGFVCLFFIHLLTLALCCPWGGGIWVGGINWHKNMWYLVYIFQGERSLRILP